jgi:lysophospholipase L1-like esterase
MPNWEWVDQPPPRQGRVSPPPSHRRSEGCRKASMVIATAALAVFVLAATALAFAASAARADGPLTVMPFGDSITAGIGDPAGGGYRCTLKTMLAAQGQTIDYVGSAASGPCTDNQHEGHSGWTIAQLTAIAADRVTAYQPDVVLLMAGTNDLKLGQTAGINDRLGALIDTIHAARPDTTIIVSTIPAYPAADQAAWRAYRGDVPTIALEHGAYAAYGHNVRGNQLADGIHPNAACGYPKVSFYFDAAITQARPSPNGRTWAPVWPAPVAGCS